VVRIGLIGAGKWGRNHLRIFSEINCELVGICDVNPATKKLADEYNIVYEKDYRELLPLVDAVSIVTPTDMHYNIVKDCLLAGKHVFVEKPLTTNSNEANELVDLTNVFKKILAVGYLYRFNPVVMRLKEGLKDAGKIHYITMRYIHSSKPPRKDTGTIFNFASHLFDILNFVLDEMPKRIFCKKVNYLSKEREDFASILLDYGDFVASLEVSWLHPLKKRDAWIIASNEKIYADFLEQGVRKYFIDIDLDRSVNRGVKDTKIEKREPLREELIHFLDCIEHGREPINNGKEACKVTKLCELALESARTGKEVTV